jgi:hypothetical protein
MRYPLAIVIAPLVAAHIGVAFAVIIPRLTLEEVTGSSPLIVHARVGNSWTAWDGKKLFVWTHHRIEVLAVWKGNFNGELVVSEPGGTLDGISMEFPETVRYRPGEELVLFLYRTPIGYWRARGYSQGKFPVAAGPDGVRGVRLATAGLDLADTGKPLAGRARTSIREADGLSLDQFRTRVLGMAGPR